MGPWRHQGWTPEATCSCKQVPRGWSPGRGQQIEGCSCQTGPISPAKSPYSVQVQQFPRCEPWGIGVPRCGPWQIFSLQALWSPYRVESCPYNLSKQSPCQVKCLWGPWGSPVVRIPEIRGKSGLLLTCSTHLYSRSHWGLVKGPSAWYSPAGFPLSSPLTASVSSLRQVFLFLLKTYLEHASLPHVLGPLS